MKHLGLPETCRSFGRARVAQRSIGNDSDTRHPTRCLAPPMLVSLQLHEYVRGTKAQRHWWWRCELPAASHARAQYPGCRYHRALGHDDRPVGLQTVGGAQHLGLWRALSLFCRASSAGLGCNWLTCSCHRCGNTNTVPAVVAIDTVRDDCLLIPVPRTDSQDAADPRESRGRRPRKRGS